MSKTNVEESINVYKQQLQSEFKRLSTIALEYRIKIQNSKTKIKLDLYQKKLAKVNKKVYVILAQLTMLDNKDIIRPEVQVND